jgi:thiol-disulfide isomerase/thioredoxin
MSDFQERMRKLVTGGSGSRQSDGSTTTTSATRRPRNVQEVQTLQEYRRVVSDEADKLVVVRFYATWCKACRAVAPSFYRMARDFPGVKFVEVPVTDTSIVIHQGLGVEKLPYLHMYHPQAGLVEELRFKRRQVPTALAKLQSYVEGECKLGPDVSSPYEESATTKTTGRP